MAYEQAAAEMEEIFQEYLALHDWRGAVQTRVQAASLAYRHGRMEIFRLYSQEAIELAARYGLKDQEISQRAQRFRYLLQADSSGQTLDELRQEIDFTTRLRGRLAESLEEYYQEALRDCDAVRANLKSASEGAGGNSSFEKPLNAQWADLAASVERAQRQAEDFALLQRGGLLADCAEKIRSGIGLEQACAQIAITLEDTEREITQKYQASRVSLLQLAAELKERLGDSETAEEARSAVEVTGQDLPDRRYIQKLHQIMQTQGATEKVLALVAQAHQSLLDGRFEAALPVLDDALQIASTPILRRTVIRERLLVFCETGRYPEAEADVAEALALLDKEILQDSDSNADPPADRIREEESLYLIQAYIQARLGRPAAAWEAAEQGRAQSLKREIIRERTGTQAPLGRLPFEEVKAWLASERIALLSFGSTRWGTLALSVGPGEAEPEATFLQMRQKEVEDALSSPQWGEDSQLWTARIFGAVPELSARLLQPLQERILALACTAQTLIFLPDSFLFRAPFAALTLTDGRTLMEVSPLALAPSVSLLMWCQFRRRQPRVGSCLAVAVGESEGYSFRDQAARLGAMSWPAPFRALLDEEATVERVTQEAPAYTVTHFACHGAVSSDVHDTLGASQLVLADQRILSARDVSHWQMDASLVFLNACQSGRFRLESRTQVNGFWRAFLLAGATSVLGALTHVHPEPALALAEIFYREWLGGATKAEALNRAQRQLKTSGREPQDWASHCLIGDYL